MLGTFLFIAATSIAAIAQLAKTASTQGPMEACAPDGWPRDRDWFLHEIVPKLARATAFRLRFAHEFTLEAAFHIRSIGRRSSS
ncbi:MAG: hypothetical protein JO192_13145 [Candidatus Eremiobacteraeota bacterium]|nr:hypothetical protein [Candidatus Eremiobacteraeota bacterium]MBV8333677.1 hypothetical protein [Candidatus Eremiobacteraeota bacterium]MBV8723512.1 hypothetical protein [Candidatus Eremiobacteraeota bacterium]